MESEAILRAHGSAGAYPDSMDTPTLPPPPPAIIQGAGAADPDIHLFGDKYYIYPTSDTGDWNQTSFSAWSSPDLIHWKAEGVILDLQKDVAWGHGHGWAPSMAFRNGKYYFYFVAEHQIGVAIGDTPTGPFKDALGKPLVVRDPKINSDSIDPFCFIDDDGQAWLYWGSGTMTAYKLKPDMITLDGPPTAIPIADFREGTVVFKRKGRYYFMWSEDDTRSEDYRIGYGTGTSPLGPVTVPPDNIILQKHGDAKGTGHNSVLNIPGTDRWYIAYHRFHVPGGDGYHRETCLGKMEFAPDGTIKPVDPLEPAFPPGAKGEPLANP
jgi:beta-xylosidase